MGLTRLLPTPPKPAPTATSNATDIESKAQSWIAERWPKLKVAFTIYHSMIWESLLFYAGQTWLQYDQVRSTFVTQRPADDWVPQPKINRFAPAIDSIASNFGNIPEIEVVPSPIDNDDAIQIANVADKLSKFAMKEYALRADYKSQEDKAGEAGQIFVLAGSVYTLVFPEDKKIGEKPVFDQVPMMGVQCAACDTYNKVPPEQAPQACPNCGGPVSTQQTMDQQPQMDPESGQPVTEPVTEKRIRVMVGNPLNAFWRPGATGMHNTRYMGWAQRISLIDIKKYWGCDATADELSLDGFSTNYESQLNYFYTGFSSKEANMKDSALVLQVFMEPDDADPDFPQGLYAVYINEKIQLAEPWPFLEHPITKADYMQLPTMFQGRTPAFELTGLQKEYQSYEALIKLHGMTSAVEPIIIDANTVVTEPTGRADKIIKWRSVGPGSKEPHRMAHGVLDEGIYRQRQSIREEFENVSGTVSVFKGQQPGSITAASGLAILKGQAEQMFAKPVQNWNALWKETIRKIVTVMQANFTLDQLVEILGEDASTQIAAFKAANLDKCVEFVATQNGLPRTRSERKQEMMELFDHGALDINDPNVRQKVFELFGETGMMRMFNEDASRARLENKQFQQGQFDKVKFMPEIEDMQVHFAIHSEALKSLEYDKWNPEAQKALFQHALQTKQAMQMVQGPGEAPPPPPANPAPPNGKPPEVKNAKQ